MSWTYHQQTGKLLDPSGAVVGTGYSGAPPLGKNNPVFQNVKSIGPIPQGSYTIGALFNSPTHGPDSMHLTPDPANDMFGRDCFLMHGDSIAHPGSASQGCIIMPRAIRELVANSGDDRLVVLA